MQNDYTIRYNNRFFQLENKQNTEIKPKDRITVRESLVGSITLIIRNIPLFFHEIKQSEPVNHASTPWDAFSKNIAKHPTLGKKNSKS